MVSTTNLATLDFIYHLSIFKPALHGLIGYIRLGVVVDNPGVAVRLLILKPCEHLLVSVDDPHEALWLCFSLAFAVNLGASLAGVVYVGHVDLTFDDLSCFIDDSSNTIWFIVFIYLADVDGLGAFQYDRINLIQLI